jgi:hypothetical protein
MRRTITLSIGVIAAIVHTDAVLSDTARQNGVEAAWKACQPCRQKYDTYRLAAETNLAQGNVAAAAKAAMDEFSYMFEGMNIRLASTGNGVTVWVWGAGSDVASQRTDLTLSQFNELLVEGQYDNVLEKSIPVVVSQVAKSNGIRIEQNPPPNGTITKLSRLRPLQKPPPDNEDVLSKFKREEEERPGYKTQKPYQAPEFHGKLTAVQKLEQRSYAIFPRAPLDADENAKREQWMAQQEQQAIVNEINRSKPLIFPVGGSR